MLEFIASRESQRRGQRKPRAAFSTWRIIRWASTRLAWFSPGDFYAAPYLIFQRCYRDRITIVMSE